MQVRELQEQAAEKERIMSQVNADNDGLVLQLGALNAQVGRRSADLTGRVRPGLPAGAGGLPKIPSARLPQGDKGAPAPPRRAPNSTSFGPLPLEHGPQRNTKHPPGPTMQVQQSHKALALLQTQYDDLSRRMRLLQHHSFDLQDALEVCGPQVGRGRP
jgi:hypothetical protein